MDLVIETTRLSLRELNLDDQERLAQILCDPESMRYYPRPFTFDEVRQWIDWNTRNYVKYGHGLWAVIRKDDGTFLGDCGITMQKIDGQELPEVGYHIRKDNCNKGFATEAAQACINLVFKSFPYNALYSYMRTDNAASIRVAEKNGMHFVKCFRKIVLETIVEESLYCIDRPGDFR